MAASVPAFIEARRLPFLSDPDPRLAGFRFDGRVWCANCAPLSVYYYDRGRRAPPGWVKLLLKPRSQAPACVECDEPLWGGA